MTGVELSEAERWRPGDPRRGSMLGPGDKPHLRKFLGIWHCSQRRPYGSCGIGDKTMEMCWLRFKAAFPELFHQAGGRT